MEKLNMRDNKELKQSMLKHLTNKYGSLAQVSRVTQIPLRTLENWKYGNNVMSDYVYYYLTLFESKIDVEVISERIYKLKHWIYSDNSICKEDREYLDYELSYIMTLLKGAHELL